MKILFVCRGNVSRSQMAAALYNRMTKTNDASSAGTHVKTHGQTLQDRRRAKNGKSHTMDVMEDAGFDLRAARQTQLTREMLPHYEQIINMAAKRFTPRWLSSAPNYMYWKIQDPRGRSVATTLRAKHRIEEHLSELLAEKKT